MKKILKNRLVLPVFMVVMMVCTFVFGMTAYAATLTNNLSVSDVGLSVTGDGTWNASGTAITGQATGYEVYGIISGTKDTTITIKNNKSEEAKLSFDYTLTNGGSVSGAISSTSGSYSEKIAAGSSISIKLTSPSGSATNTLTISNLSLVVEKDVTTTFKAVENGTYTVNGTAITANTEKTQLSTTAYTVNATAAAGYKFFGWYNETAGEYLSYESSASIICGEDCVVVPEFIADNVAIFKAGGTYFYNLNEAGQFAKKNSIDKVVLVESGILTGSHTVPAGVTLLIPFDDTYTCYTTEPENVGYTGGITIGSITTGANSNDWAQPTPYKTLTMAEGSKIIVRGEMSLSAKHAFAEGSQTKGGSPSGPCSYVEMENGSDIVVKNGGGLYVWGFITGDGNVTAESGAKVYENMQITDFRGGAATSNMVSGGGKIFPFSQYYVQNIEVKEILEYGAEEYIYTSVFMNGGGYSSSVKFIGQSGGLFTAGEGSTVSKDYIEERDRLLIEASGDMKLGSLELSVSTISFNSEDYILPINSNITINMLSGTTEIGQEIALLPGVELNIGEDAELKLTSDAALYVYDGSEWGGYVSSANSRFVPLTYVFPGRTYNRTTADLVDVVVDVNGTITAEGALYTTASGANIKSSAGTGKVVFVNAAGTATSTAQAVQGGNGSITETSIAITSAKLQNADGSYVTTSDAVAGDMYVWNTLTDKWEKATAATVTFDANTGDGSMDALILAAGEKTVLTANTFTKEGYTFDGWNTKADGTGKAYADGTSVAFNSDITLYAQWKVNTYTITYKDGDTVIGNPITKEYGASLADVEAPALPVKEGYTCAAWEALPATMPAKDIVISANWTINQYTITFDTAGGTAIAPITQDYGTAVTAPANPTKEGYYFDGWDQTIPATMPAENLTITAQWSAEPVTYTVEWDQDGDGKIDKKQTNLYAGDEFDEYDAFEKEGYTFAGWVDADGNAVEVPSPAVMPEKNLYFKATYDVNTYTITYKDGDSDIAKITDIAYGSSLADVKAPSNPTKTGYTFAGWDTELPATMPAKDIIITAQWKVNQYTITYKDGDQTLAEYKKDYSSSLADVKAPAAPTKAGYTFAGWDVELPATMPAEDIVITAKWEKIAEVTVMLMVDGKEFASFTGIPGTAIKLEKNPEKEGYTFTGWTDADGKDTELPTSIPETALTLNAKWTANQYTITFNTNGGSAVASITADCGSKITAPAAPTKTGYSFAGWDQAIPETMPAGDMTITAKWTVNKYTITFNTDGGSAVASITADYGSKITVPANPTKDGYEFAGWDQEIPATMPANNMTITAKWEKNVIYRVCGNTNDYGIDRYGTSYKTADALKAQLGVDKFDTVIVACGTNFADALAGSYLANQKNAPILMSDDSVISRLKSYVSANVKDTGTIYILGGELAVSKKVENALKAAKPNATVKRLAGKDRYGTNLEILKEANVTKADEILVTKGSDFADSLSASATNRPILLVGSTLTKDQKSYLSTIKGCKFYIIGGTYAVGSNIESQMKSYGTFKSRVWGNTRYDTTIAVAKEFFPDATSAVLATGNKFPDGLCGGPLAKVMNCPLILTYSGVEAKANSYITTNNIQKGMALGGNLAVTDASIVKIFNLKSASSIVLFEK